MASAKGKKSKANQEERHQKVVVVMPAYNAETTLEKTVLDLSADAFDEIIVVDDRSTDRTVEVAKALGLRVIVHERNSGYGANQKTCYSEALESGADIVVMVHPDYQYDSRLVPFMVGFIANDVCDIVLGSRIRTRAEALASGMPIYKYIFNRILTFIENVGLGQNLGDFHTGYRAYSRKVLETVPFELNSDDFVFDSQFLAQAVHFGFRIGDVPVPCRYFAEASSINFRRSVTYGTLTLATLLRYALNRTGLISDPLFKPKKP